MIDADDPMAPWPDLMASKNMSTLLTMFPTSKLLQLYRMEAGGSDRAAAWADLGITDPMQQAQLEMELDAFIEQLTRNHTHA